MTEQNNTYWQGVQTGQAVNTPITPDPQAQPGASSVPMAQPYTPQQSAPYTTSYQQPPSPYATAAQPANPYTGAQPNIQQQPASSVQPVQSAQQSAATFTQSTQPVQQAGYPQTQPVYAQPPSPGAYPVQQPQKYSGIAIAGMVLGIVALVFLFGDDESTIFIWIVCTILSLIFSIVGMTKTNRAKPGAQKGRGMAIAGLVLSIVSICLFVLLIVLGILFAVAMYDSGSLYDFSNSGTMTTMASLLM